MEHPIIFKLQADLLTARKANAQTTVQALQSLLTRITNAEAVAPAPSTPNMGVGVGATEATRKALTDAEIHKLIAAELAEIQEALAGMADHPDHPYTQELQAKASIVGRYL